MNGFCCGTLNCSVLLCSRLCNRYCCCRCSKLSCRCRGFSCVVLLCRRLCTAFPLHLPFRFRVPLVVAGLPHLRCILPERADAVRMHRCEGVGKRSEGMRVSVCGAAMFHCADTRVLCSSPDQTYSVFEAVAYI